MSEHPHRRYNVLSGEWVLVSPHRTARPWQGRVESTAGENRPPHDPDCYLCPGNQRANQESNPAYTGTYVFVNDFAALLPNCSDAESGETSALLRNQPVRGTCRVICFSPRHDLSLARMELGSIRGVIDEWARQTQELGRDYHWVQIFENKGAVMGCSNPHPHGQIWAGDFLPNEAAKEDGRQRAWFEQAGRLLLLDYAKEEIQRGERIVVENEDWLVVVPYWAVWPFETLLLPKGRQLQRFSDLQDSERDSLAKILKRLLVRYDNLFETSFPYSMGWHGGPTGPGDHRHWQLHAHFMPPLLRSASVKKFMVGYEMLAEAQRDITPEWAAQRLRDLSEIHYLDSPRALIPTNQGD